MDSYLSACLGSQKEEQNARFGIQANWSTTRQSSHFSEIKITMRTVLAFIAGIALFGIVGCGNSEKVDACVNRGVAYFKEMGSYPTLRSAPNTGRRAEDVARERCNRTTTAF